MKWTSAFSETKKNKISIEHSFGSTQKCLCREEKFNRQKSPMTLAHWEITENLSRSHLQQKLEFEFNKTHLDDWSVIVVVL